ncbi:hypothetical protein [Polaribacter aestuariivivens]|uniref:hypothetical protein n=1 Tax=Polaribacter aestuariivivens TaxID=2304626 RepID=UPI003F4953CB
MIKINHIKKPDLLLFVKVLENYINVVEVHTTSPEDYKIQKSISEVLIKQINGKIKHTQTTGSILFQLNHYQAIVLTNALICYKSSPLIKRSEKLITNLIFNNLNHQLKYYAKAS